MYKDLQSQDNTDGLEPMKKEKRNKVKRKKALQAYKTKTKRGRRPKQNPNAGDLDQAERRPATPQD